MNDDNYFKKYTHEAAKKAFEGKPLSDESVENAFIHMRGRIANGELTPEVYQKKERGELSLVKEVMQINIARLKLKKQKMARLSLLVTCFLLILSLSIGIPVYQDNIWKSMISYTQVSKDSLNVAPVLTIYDLNIKKSAHFYWLDHMEKVDTLMYYYQKKPVMLEETYMYENVKVSLCIVNKFTNVLELNDEVDSVFTYNNKKIYYIINAEAINCQFYNIYKYVITIESGDTSLLEPILKNLVKN